MLVLKINTNCNISYYSHPSFLLKLAFCTLYINFPFEWHCEHKAFLRLDLVSRIIISFFFLFALMLKLSQLSWRVFSSLNFFAQVGNNKAFTSYPHFCPEMWYWLVSKELQFILGENYIEDYLAWELIVGWSAVPTVSLILVVTELGKTCVFLRLWSHTDVF